MRQLHVHPALALPQRRQLRIHLVVIAHPAREPHQQRARRPDLWPNAPYGCVLTAKSAGAKRLWLTSRIRLRASPKLKCEKCFSRNSASTTMQSISAASSSSRDSGGRSFTSLMYTNGYRTAEPAGARAPKAKARLT